MNKQRRKQALAAVEALVAVWATIETLRDEEQDAFDAMPESFQSAERGEKVQENIDALTEIFETVQEQMHALEDVANG